MKKVFSIMLSLVLLIAIATPIHAAENDITEHSHSEYVDASVSESDAHEHSDDIAVSEAEIEPRNVICTVAGHDYVWSVLTTEVVSSIYGCYEMKTTELGVCSRCNSGKSRVTTEVLREHTWVKQANNTNICSFCGAKSYNVR